MIRQGHRTHHTQREGTQILGNAIWLTHTGQSKDQHEGLPVQGPWRHSRKIQRTRSTASRKPPIWGEQNGMKAQWIWHSDLPHHCGQNLVSEKTGADQYNHRSGAIDNEIQETRQVRREETYPSPQIPAEYPRPCVDPRVGCIQEDQMLGERNIHGPPRHEVP